MILKFQKALNNNNVLITGKNVCAELPIKEKLDNYFGDDFKFYAECIISKSTVIILKKVKSESW